MSRAAGYRPPDTIELIRMNLSMLEQSLKNEDTGTAAKCVDAAEAMFKGLRQVCSAAGCDVGPSKWEERPNNLFQSESAAEIEARLQHDEEVAERNEIPPPPPRDSLTANLLRDGIVTKEEAVNSGGMTAEQADLVLQSIAIEHKVPLDFLLGKPPAGVSASQVAADRARFVGQRIDAQMRAERKMRDFGAAGGLDIVQRTLGRAWREGQLLVPTWLMKVSEKRWGWGVLARLTWAWWCCAAGMFVRFIKAERKDRR